MHDSNVKLTHIEKKNSKQWPQKKQVYYKNTLLNCILAKHNSRICHRFQFKFKQMLACAQNDREKAL